MRRLRHNPSDRDNPRDRRRGCIGVEELSDLSSSLVLLQVPSLKEIMAGIPRLILTCWHRSATSRWFVEPAEEGLDLFTGAVEAVRYTFETDQDLDYDQQPDDWTRRIGPGFPHYVSVEIDRTQGQQGRQSLEFEANGGPAIVYSPACRRRSATRLCVSRVSSKRNTPNTMPP